MENFYSIVKKTSLITASVIVLLLSNCKDNDDNMAVEKCYPSSITFSNATAAGLFVGYEYNDNNDLIKVFDSKNSFTYEYINNKVGKVQEFLNGVAGNDYEYEYNSDGSISRTYWHEKKYYQEYNYLQGKMLPASSHIYGKDELGEYQKFDENYKYEFDGRGNLIKEQLYEGTEWVRDNQFTYDDKVPFFKYIPQYITFISHH